MRYYLIMDGGTTNLRVMLTDAQGNLLDCQRRMVGAAATAVAGSNQALREAARACIHRLLEAHHLRQEDIARCIAFGMITCASGLKEVAHLSAPAGYLDFRQGMVSQHFPDIASFPIEFIPGLRNFSGAVTLENVAQMDMMRGEETEALGFFHLMQPASPCVLILPGSHNKLIALDEKGNILRCMTTISGELLSALTQHTILSEAVDGKFVQDGQYDRDMLLAGAKGCEAGLGRAAFSARILRTLGHLPQEKIASFLLGVVLRSDVDALNTFVQGQENPRLYIAGKEPLQRALVDLFAHFGHSAQAVPPEITQRIGIMGAMRIAGLCK